MLRIEAKQQERREEFVREHGSDGDGLLVLAMLVASWMIVVGFVWAIWRMAPL